MAALYPNSEVVQEFLHALGVNTKNCKEVKILFMPGAAVTIETTHYADLEGAIDTLRTRRFRLVEESESVDPHSPGRDPHSPGMAGF